jgi:uncharacterized protein YjbJ (UPF0337 family)
MSDDKQNGKYNHVIDQVAAKAKEVAGKMNENQSKDASHANGRQDSLTDKMKGVFNHFQKNKK